MIRINLLGEQVDRSASYAIHSLILLACVVLILMLGGWSTNHAISVLSDLENQVALKESQHTKLKNTTKKVEDLEQKQKLLIEKLEIIAKLKTRKQGPVRILDDLTKMIPDRAWLTSISQRNDFVEVSGVAVDGQTISDFIAQIRESRFIEDADEVKAQMVMRDDVKLQSFTFPAKLSELLTLKKSADSEDASTSKKKKRSKKK
jgi:type IV pilus assembly protein PilN